MPTHYIGLIEPLLEHGVPLKATVEQKLLLPEHRGPWVVRVERAAEGARLSTKVAKPIPEPVRSGREP